MVTLKKKCCCGDCCCDPAPATYAVTFAGVTDGTSTGCTLANTKFCLCRFSCGEYDSRAVPLDGSTVSCSTTYNSFRCRLRFRCGDDLVRLEVIGGCTFTGAFAIVATYELARGDWNCSGDSVLDLISSEDNCNDWPATVTVSIDDGTFSCDCQCGGGPGNLTSTVTYEMRMGAMTDDECAVGCGCEFPYTRICLRDLMTTGCDWEGEWWSNFAGYVSVTVPAAGGCTPAVEAGTVTARTAVLRYESSTNLVVAGWMDGTNWIARYTLAADSFDPFGTNTLTYDSGTYDLCTLPGTITVAYFSTDNDDCNDVTSFDGTFPDSFRCTVCGTWSAGFTFTVSGVTGATIDGGVPCETMNGDYCIGTVAGCLWDTDHGYGPDAAVVASMEIVGGMVFLRIGTGSCNQFLVYQISVDDFDCTGTNILDLVCDGPLPYAGATGETDCGCANAPATLTITPTEECGTPPAGCECLPKASYSPRALITGIDDGTCTDCGCVSTLDLCFEATGSASECTWRADFTLPTGDPAACWTAAAYALLTVAGDDFPGLAVIQIYDGSDVLLAQFDYDFALFDCDDTDQLFDPTYSSDTCDWSGATCTLNMHGEDCSACLCGDEMYNATIVYDSVEYEICALVEGCSGTSNVMPIGGGNGLRVKIDFGTSVARYARLFVYFVPSSGPEVLIGVYNYLSDISSFECDASNTVHLATGNAGQCGADIDEDGYTDLLGATATIGPFSMPVTCSGTPMPMEVTVAISADLVENCECREATGTAYYDCISGKWLGELLCDPPGAGGEFTMNVEFYLTGSGPSSARLYVAWNDGCDSPVTLSPSGTPTCGAIEFYYAGGDGTFTVTW